MRLGVRQRVVAQIDELVLGVIALRGEIEDPAGDLLAVAVGTALPRMIPIRGISVVSFRFVGRRGP
jgi:hypothetical protein